MLVIALGTLVIIASVSVALLGLGLTRPFIRRHFAEQHNEISAAMFAMVGALYAVVLAFVVVASLGSASPLTTRTSPQKPQRRCSRFAIPRISPDPIRAAGAGSIAAPT